jgi:hypothetical protein
MAVVKRGGGNTRPGVVTMFWLAWKVADALVDTRVDWYALEEAEGRYSAG